MHLTTGEARLAGRPVAGLRAVERAGLVGYLPQDRRVAWNMPAWRIAIGSRPSAISQPRFPQHALASSGGELPPCICSYSTVPLGIVIVLAGGTRP